MHRQLVVLGREGSSSKFNTFMPDEQYEAPGLLQSPSPHGKHLVAPRTGWNIPASHSTQLLLDAEGIQPRGHWQQMGEAAAAKEPKGHGVHADEGRPLKPRMMMERTMARSLDA